MRALMMVLSPRMMAYTRHSLRRHDACVPIDRARSKVRTTHKTPAEVAEGITPERTAGFGTSIVELVENPVILLVPVVPVHPERKLVECNVER